MVGLFNDYDIAASDLDADIHRDIQCTEKLLKDGEQFYYTTDSETRRRLLRNILNTIYEMVSLKYDKMIRADAVITSSTFDDHRQQLMFIFSCLDHSHQMDELSDDFVKWMMSRFLRSRMSILVDAKFGGFLQEKILHLAGLLKDKDSFLCYMVMQLAGLVNGENSFSLSETTGKFDSHFTFSDISDSRCVIYLSLLDIIRHVNFNFASLSCKILHILWLSLVKICCLKAPRLKATCVLLFQRLLSLDLANEIVCRLVFDVIMGTEVLIQKQLDCAGLETLVQAHESCLKVLVELLEATDKKSFNNIAVSVVLSWGIRAAELGLSYLVLPARFEIVTTTITRLLSRLDGDFNEEHLQFINRLADLTQNLVKRVLELEPTSSSDNIERLHSYYSFLMNTDTVLSQSVRGEWITSYCETRWQALITAGKHGSAMKIRRITTAAVALCSGENASSLLFSIMPTEQQLIQGLEAASSMGSSASDVSLTVFEIVGDMISHQTKFPLAVSVAFLSLPWLVDPELQLHSKRHMTSLPLLKEMTRLAKLSFISSSDDSVLVNTLSALSKVHGFCDWRRTILLSAMSSHRSALVQAALSHLSMFVSSLDAPSLHRLLIPAIELASSATFTNCEVDMSCVLNALSHSMCASHPNRSVHDAAGVTCTICEKFVAGTPIQEYEKIDQLPGLFELLIQVLNDHRYKKEKHVRLEAVGLLLAALCHVQCPPHLYHHLVKASLGFINDEDEDVRNIFQSAFKVIVSGPLPLDLIEAIFCEHFCAECPPECEQTMMEASAPFLVISARHSSSPHFSNRCLHQLFIRSVHFFSSVAIFNECKRTIQELSAQEFPESRDSRRFFARRKRAFCSDLVNEMLSFWRDGDDYSDEIFYEEIDSVLQTAQELFNFESISSFIRSSDSIVSLILLSNVEAKEVAKKLLDRLSFHLSKHRQDLILEYFPSVLERPLSSAKKNFLKTFIKDYCDLDLKHLLYKKRYVCTVYVLQSIALDIYGNLEVLQNIFNRQIRNNSREPFSLTAVMKYNCEYLGFLLSFRRSLLDDDHYEQRSDLLASFATIIKLIDEKFLEETCNKVMVVLRAATSVGEGSVAVWTEFVRRLSDGMLASLLPKILIALQPLLKFSATNDLLDNIFGRRKLLEIEQSEAFERTAMVLVNSEGGDSSHINHHLRRAFTDDSTERIISGCVRMLVEECDTVGRMVLHKLLSVLDGNTIPDVLAANLIPALLHTMRNCGDGSLRVLSAECLGRLGAVDPGRIGSAGVTSDLVQKKIVFVDDAKEFYVDILEGAWRVYSSILDADLLDQVEYALQSLLSELVGKTDEFGIMERLSDECRRDIEPFRSSSLVQTHDSRGPIIERPIVDHVSGYEEWLLQCFIIGVPKVRQHPEKELFKALKWIVFAKDSVFTRHVLPQLIIRLILENNESIINEYCDEMTTVLRRVVTSSAGWMRLAAHVVFSVLDTLEQYAIRRLVKKRSIDKELERTQLFLSRIFSEMANNGSLLVVVAAERCQCMHRALRWCEQHEIEYNFGCGNFDRNHFYTLERIYTQLQNIDGVLGSFECISSFTSPTADERILALEAIGDYNEALPLYSQSVNSKELQLIKCLLRLNQPQLALNTAVSFQEREETSPQLANSLASSQLEATWHLRDWCRLEKMVQKSDPLLDRDDSSWGAACASLLCAVKRRESGIFYKRLLAARQRLVERITAKTIEDSNTYTQAYKYIVNLQILEEIDECTRSLALLPSQRSVNLKAVLDKWHNRSECVVQCSNILEPILKVRRELLRAAGDLGAVAGPDVDNAITQLLVQSCRLARQSGHLQIAWTFLVEAKALGVNLKDVGMEEARFEFQKGNQSQAIGLLTKLLNTEFSEMNKIFTRFVQWHESGSKNTADSPDILVKHTSKESRAAFAEVQLLRAEYMLKSGAVAATDLYQIYLSLQKFDVPSEDLHYRVAVFCDGMYSMDTEKVRSDLVANILKSYTNALRFGRNHLFHAMPRMLTIWLDVSQKKTEAVQNRGADSRSTEMNKRDNVDISQMNSEISRAFRQLDSYTFYTAFPQLISRIVHPNASVFSTLKAILADLICKYPHQCLWQSIAVYRTGPWQKNIRQERCAQVFTVVKNKHHNMDQLIDQYDYVAAILIELAEKKLKSCGSFSDLPVVSARLYNFFSAGELQCDLLMGAKERGLSGIRIVSPSVMIPLTEMLEHALPKDHDDKVYQFSQFVMDAATPEQASLQLPEVFISSVDPDYLVLKSLLRPKRIALRGGDGRRYLIMCKPCDELRKDARFMDVNRMMNSLMRQNADARRRQLTVRTFSVIPLQDAGGIVEWLPNLVPYRGVLQPLFEEKGDPLPDAQWFTNWNVNSPVEDRVERMRSTFYHRYPLVMAEWFRRQFTDPSVWYAARLTFARSCAVMSMIGFVLGLGDRHGENILVDVMDGCVVHVDFNLIFHKGEYLPVREVVPFRLTRNMVNGFGPTGVEGSFRRSCESTLRVMRENKDTLLTVIQTFVHDPLLEWINTEARAQQNKGRCQQKFNAPSAESVQLILKRLEGHIVSPEVYKHKFSCAPMSLEGQVAKLIDIASDERNLAQMYIGWGPFI